MGSRRTEKTSRQLLEDRRCPAQELSVRLIARPAARPCPPARRDAGGGRPDHIISLTIGGIWEIMLSMSSNIALFVVPRRLAESMCLTTS